MIPGSGRSAGEGKGYPLQYSWASLVAQLVKNLPAMQETWVWSLGWQDPLEKGKATHPSILTWRIPWTVSSVGLQRVKEDWATFTFTFMYVFQIEQCLTLNRRLAETFVLNDKNKNYQEHDQMDSSATNLTQWEDSITSVIFLFHTERD